MKALDHHTECEPQTLGASLPTVTNRGLACHEHRHAGRSGEMP